jgi:hypothetical protein
MKFSALIIIVAVDLCSAQSDFNYMPRARGHYISNGQYQNQAREVPISSDYQYQQQQPFPSTNVIGNTAENVYGGGTVVNSVVNPSRGNTNVIGNMARNVYGGTVNSVGYPSSKWVHR